VFLWCYRHSKHAFPSATKTEISLGNKGLIFLFSHIFEFKVSEFNYSTSGVKKKKAYFMLFMIVVVI